MKVRLVLCCVILISAIIVFFPGCSQRDVHGQSAGQFDSWPFGYTYKQVAALTLGADNAFVSGFIVKLPEGVPPEYIYDIIVKYMGDLDGVMALAIWDSVADAERLLFTNIENNPILLVLEFTDSSGHVVGHSLTNSPIVNAITHECYIAEIEEVIWDWVWGPINYCMEENRG